MSKRCVICCKESFPMKLGMRETSSKSFPHTEDVNCQQAEGNDIVNSDMQIMFLLHKLLEIPDDTLGKLRQYFGNTSGWVECCDYCSHLVENCKVIYEQMEMLQKQYEELRSNIKSTMLKSQKTLSLESKCEIIVRSHVITKEVESFINTSLTEINKETFPDRNINCNSNNCPMPARSPDDCSDTVESNPLFKSINNAMIEGETISFDESSDFQNNIHSEKACEYQQNVCGPIQSENLIKEIYPDISIPVNNHNANPSESEESESRNLSENAFSDIIDEVDLSVKSNENSRGINYPVNTINTINEEEPKMSKMIDKGDGEKKHECHICLQLFALPRQLKIHLLTHSGAKNKHKCDFCGKGFRDKSTLQIHLRIHTGERPYECSICGKCYKCTKNLKDHMTLHSGRKPFVCKLCGTPFKTAENLKRHTVLHSGKKPFECDICGRCFITAGKLKEHAVLHSGERPFECDICGLTFTRKGYLRDHYFTHTGEKPYECDICGLKFARKGYLKVHYFTHTGEKPFECDICGLKFTRKDYLKNHEVTHMEENPFKCDICDKPFKYNKNLSRHRLKHIGQSNNVH